MTSLIQIFYLLEKLILIILIYICYSKILILWIDYFHSKVNIIKLMDKKLNYFLFLDFL